MTDLEVNAWLEKRDQEVFKLHDPRNRMVYELSKYIHLEEWIKAGKVYETWVRETKDNSYRAPGKKDEITLILSQLLVWCLNNDRYELGARMLWTEAQFDPRPHFCQLIWNSLRKNSMTMMMGSASAGKSFSTGVYMLLDWIRDPEYTAIRLVGPSEDHLNANLFSHMVNLHRSAALPIPGECGDRFIGLDRRDLSSAVLGVVIPLGQKAAGRLQGAKAGNKKRKTPHPQFGTLARLKILIDESERVPPGIWKDVSNLMANVTSTGNFSLAASYNPEDQNGPSGVRSEPPGGWDSFDIDKHETWVSRRGWNVVRLDGLKGENVRFQRTIFQGLQTYEGIQSILTESGGYDSPGWSTMARAAFPRSLAKLSVIPQGLLDQAKAQFIFLRPPSPVAGCDLAGEGGDSIPFYWGELGLAVGYRTMPTIKDPHGKQIDFKDEFGRSVARPALQVTGKVQLEAGSSPKLAAQIRDLCQKLAINGDSLCVDRTGFGQGTFDILKEMFSEQVVGINYSESASEEKIIAEDSRTPKEQYGRVDSELWFALRKFLDNKLIMFSPNVDFSKLGGQLTGRMFSPGKIDKVESKKEYKARNAGHSPDEADACTLLLHAARKKMGVPPSMHLSKGAPGANVEAQEREDGHGYTDTANRLDDLDGPGDRDSF